jgi:CTP:molybdopterin cytidylyltransferase MocA
MTRVPWAVVLAAGGSTRMGFPKALLQADGRSLVERHCAALLVAARRVVVAIGADAARVRTAVPAGITVVENPEWQQTWPADTLRRTLIEAGIRGRCLVTPVDVPPARPDTLEALLSAGAPAVPLDAAGRRGHPVLLDAALVAHLRRHGAPQGLDTLLGSAVLVPTSDPDIARDFDDKTSFDTWAGVRDGR